MVKDMVQTGGARRQKLVRNRPWLKRDGANGRDKKPGPSETSQRRGCQVGSDRSDSPQRQGPASDRTRLPEPLLHEPRLRTCDVKAARLKKRVQMARAKSWVSREENE
jgi:hypothetical protein